MSLSIGRLCPECGKGEIHCNFDDGGFIEGNLVGPDACFTFEHRCSNCGKTFELVSHTIWVDNDRRDDYVCDFCGKDWFDDPEYLARRR